jgi:hypothetical protein
MKEYGGVDVYSQIFLTPALVGGERSASHPGERTPATHWIGGWVGPRASREDVEKKESLILSGLELLLLGRPARSQSLYASNFVNYSISLDPKFATV